MALLGAQGSPAAHVAGPFAAARALLSSSSHRYIQREQGELPFCTASQTSCLPRALYPSGPVPAAPSRFSSAARAPASQGQGYQRHRSAAGAWDEARKAPRQLLCCHVFGFFLCFYLAAGETGSVITKVHQGRTDNMTEDHNSCSRGAAMAALIMVTEQLRSKAPLGASGPQLPPAGTHRAGAQHHIQAALGHP